MSALEAYNYYQRGRRKPHKYHRVRRMLDTIGWLQCGLSINLNRGWSVSALGKMKWPEDWALCKRCERIAATSRGHEGEGNDND